MDKTSKLETNSAYWKAIWSPCSCHGEGIIQNLCLYLLPGFYIAQSSVPNCVPFYT